MRIGHLCCRIICITCKMDITFENDGLDKRHLHHVIVVNEGMLSWDTKADCKLCNGAEE